MKTLKDVLENKDDYLFWIDEDNWVCFKKKISIMAAKNPEDIWDKSDYLEDPSDFTRRILTHLGFKEREYD